MPPMNNDEVKNRIIKALPDAQVDVEGDGYKYIATVISTAFEGKLPLQRHKLVYAALGDAISSGELHALTIKAATPKEVQSS